jgi:hypothetical protein
VYKLADYLNLSTFSSDWSKNAAGLAAVEKLVAQSVEKQAGDVINAAAAKTIMPAGQTFYKNIRLDPRGNIAIDFIYKAQ